MKMYQKLMLTGLVQLTCSYAYIMSVYIRVVTNLNHYTCICILMTNH